MKSLSLFDLAFATVAAACTTMFASVVIGVDNVNALAVLGILVGIVMLLLAPEQSAN